MRDTIAEGIVIVDALDEPLAVAGGRPVFALETSGSTSWPVWDRFISMRGGPKFHVGNVCNTCDVFFRRVADGSPGTEPAQSIARQLNAGISSLRNAPIREIAEIVPDGAYQVVLSVGMPYLVHSGDSRDFFAFEQVQMWKAEPYIERGPIHDPGTEYYRMGSTRLSEKRAFHEFVIPTIAPQDLHPTTVQQYRKRAGNIGTALAVSIYDVKGPAIFEDTPELDAEKHLGLAHYLLDGNHKINAASLDGRTVSVLSFIAIERSIATHDELAELVHTER